MAKLSQDRATKEESLIEVGVCLSAVDRLLGGEEMSAPKPGVVGGGSEDKAPGASSGKVLFDRHGLIESQRYPNLCVHRTGAKDPKSH